MLGLTFGIGKFGRVSEKKFDGFFVSSLRGRACRRGAQVSSTRQELEGDA